MKDSIERAISVFLRYRHFCGEVTPLDHKKVFCLPKMDRFVVRDEKTLDEYLNVFFANVDFAKTGIMLSGGIDSALLASYCPKGTIAFTLKYPEAEQIDETNQARIYADYFGLQLVEVPVTLDDVYDLCDDLILHKEAPISPIEVGLAKIASTALDYGLDSLLTGLGADCTFGGLYRLMSQRWTNQGFIDRFSFVDPHLVMRNPQDTFEFFEPFYGEPDFDADGFLSHGPFADATASYFVNASSLFNVRLIAPFEYVDRGFDIDYDAIREGYEKPILRNLFATRTNGLPTPRKYPLPRPTDYWTKGLADPENKDIFFDDAYARCSNGEQRWMLYVADRFVTMLKDRCFNHYQKAYTTGVYDLFHAGHLKLLSRASHICDVLIVGVTVDELVSYKGKHAVIPFADRIRIIRALPFVSQAIAQFNMDKLAACRKLGATAVVVGSDWKGTEKWNQYERFLNEAGIEVVYFPYTRKVSSTQIVKTIRSSEVHIL